MKTLNIAEIAKHRKAFYFAAITMVLTNVLAVATVQAKPKWPISVQVGLTSSTLPGEDLVVQVVAKSSIPADEAVVGLAFPTPGNDTPKKNILWEGGIQDPTTITKTFNLGVLTPGTYKIQVWFRCVFNSPPKRPMRATQSLYIDVRTDEVLWSTVSLRQIRRLELQRKVQGLNLKQTTREEIRKADPHLAEEIEKLNREDAILDLESTQPEGSQEVFSTDQRGEPIRTPAPPKPGAKQTTEEPM